MFIGNIPEGSSVDIEVMRYDKVKTFKTRVEAYKGNTTIYLLPLLVSGHELDLLESDTIRLMYASNSKVSMWCCKFVGTHTLDDTLLLEITSCDESKKFNRRSAFRVDCLIEASLDHVGTKHKALIKDISVEGIQIITQKQFLVDNIIDVDFTHNNQKLNLRVKVVRDIPSCSNTSYAYGCKIIEGTRKELEKMVYGIQNEILRKSRN